MEDKGAPRKTSILLKMPNWLKFGFVATLAGLALTYQITMMLEYQNVLQYGPPVETTPREYRLGNYEGAGRSPTEPRQSENNN
jgi:hypothetical protein